MQWAIPYSQAIRAPLAAVAADQANTPAVITRVAFTGDTAGRIGEAVTLGAKLTDDGGPGPLQPNEGRERHRDVAVTDGASIELSLCGWRITAMFAKRRELNRSDMERPSYCV